MAWGGVTLLGSGALILMGIITSEALYPAPYNTSDNDISDLGGTLPPHSVVLQPSATIFDVTMVVAGLMIMLGSWLALRGRRPRTALVTAVLLGAGITGIGLFPGNTSPHPYIALATFTLGGVAAIASSAVVGGPLRPTFIALGVIALLALIAGTFFKGWSPVDALGIGGVERWIAYPVVIWLIGFGGWICARPTRLDP